MTCRRPTPVALLTGFLGSGKTTFLNYILSRPDFSKSVVIVNEFGEIPLDHLLLRHVTENIRILDTGCVCCTVQGDLVDTLTELDNLSSSGEIDFDRLFIETSGLVDPIPVLHSLSVDPTVVENWKLWAVVTAVDSVNGIATLQTHSQARRQVAVADLILLTKSDLVEDGDQKPLEELLASLNPYAHCLQGNEAAVSLLLAEDQPMLEAMKSANCNREQYPENPTSHLAGHTPHSHSIESHCFVVEDPIAESAFFRWIDLLASLRGERLLRLKALVRLAEDPERPRVVQAAQHVLHDVEILDEWPNGDRRSRIVVIGENLDFAIVRSTFEKYALTQMVESGR